MVNVMVPQVLGKLIRCKGGTVISVDKACQSILGDEFLQVLGQGMGGFGFEEITDEQVISGFVLK